MEDAGRWLRQARERAGYNTARAFAAALDVEPSSLSNYERGVYAVDDNGAEKIARVLGLPIAEVRAGLGLWVPSGDSQSGPPSNAGTLTITVRSEWERRAVEAVLDALRSDRERRATEGERPSG